MTGSSFHQSRVSGSKPKDQNKDNTAQRLFLGNARISLRLKHFLVWEAVYLGSYLYSLLGVDGSHVLIVLERVLPVLLLRTDVLP